MVRLIFIYLMLHAYGAKYTYAENPFGQWLQDALGSSRTYKEAWDLNSILDLIKEEKGKHFDPHLVDLFLDNIDEFLVIRNKFHEQILRKR